MRQRQHAPVAVAMPPRVVHVVAGPAGTEVSPGELGTLVPAQPGRLRVGVIGGFVVAAGDGCGAGVKCGLEVEEDAAPLDAVVDKPVVDLVVRELLRGLSPANEDPGEVDVPFAQFLPSAPHEQDCSMSCRHQTAVESAGS